MPLNNTSDLAGKIARLLEAETRSPDFASLLAGIEKINERLDSVEQQLERSASIHHLPLTAHPSTDRFQVIEAVADEILAHNQNEKACTFEPNGRPCDHCSMCSSRGF